MGDSPHPPRHRRDSLQPGCRDCSRYPCPRCLPCPSCCCRPCCCCCRCSCCCCCWICWPRCCCPCSRLCWICWSCHCCSSCSCCLSFKNQKYHCRWQQPPPLPFKNEISGCAIQSDLLPVQCSNTFCSEGSFSLSFSGLATLIPPTLIRGKPGKLNLDMHNFNQSLTLV